MSRSTILYSCWGLLLRGVTLLLLCTCGCGNEADSRTGDSQQSPESSARTPLPELAFEVLRANDTDLLSKIVITPDFEKALRESCECSLAPDLSRHAFEEATETLKLVREFAAENGFDWENAKLAAAQIKHNREMIDYDPSFADKLDFDVLLTIESNGTTLLVELDDCMFAKGEHRTGDGFRPKELRWPGGFSVRPGHPSP